MKQVVLLFMFFTMFISVFSQENNNFEELSDTSFVNLILDFGKTYNGVSYKYGGNNSAKGFDCSGFINYIFKMAGVTLPRSSSDLYKIGAPIDLALIKKGDLLFFNTLNKGAVSHVGVVSEIDNKQIIMLHVSSSKGVQEIDIVRSDYWYSRFVIAKRFF